jgi:glycosyltransferase involved in cell wall biosynthesis
MSTGVTLDGWDLLAPAPPEGLRPRAVPSLAVVMAVRNGAAHIADALDSVLAQTRQPDEIVICDDGSTDDLDSALRPYADRVLLLRRSWRGAGAARNEAARAAHCEVVVILDCDDTWDPRRLEAIAVVLAARPDLDIVTSDAMMRSGGTDLGLISALQPFETEDQPGEILVRNFVFGHAAVDRSRLLETGGFDENLSVGEDWVAWQRLIRSGSRVGFLTAPLAEYRRRPDSLTGDRGRYLTDRVALLERSLRATDLTERERDRVTRRLVAERFKAARHALAARSPTARSLCLALARDPRARPGTRLRAAGAAALPGVGRRLAIRRDRASAGQDTTEP